MPEKSESRWLARFKEKPDALLTLICFPYAGGTAASFRLWQDSLPGSIQLSAVQLPGRSERLLEPPFRQLPEMVQALGPALLPFLNKPFAFFGHSMGALIILELTRWLRLTENPMPVHLFVSGCRAPHLRNDGPPSHDLPQREFIERLRQLNGTPPDALTILS